MALSIPNGSQIGYKNLRNCCHKMHPVFSQGNDDDDNNALLGCDLFVDDQST